MSNIFIKETDSASETFLISFKLKDQDEKIFLKCWYNSNPNVKRLNYETQVYNQISKNILKKYPNAPFINFFINAVVKNKESLYTKIIEMSDLNERDQEYLKNQLEFIEKRIKYNLQTKNRPSGRKRFYFAKQINYIATYSIENPKSFLDLIRDTETTTETLVMCLQQIIQGICMLRKNQISHNDLHAGNILFDKNLKAHIFDFDRSYSTSLGNNQLEGFEYINNQNVFNDWPLDFYKILCYVPIAVRDKIYAIIGRKI